MKTITSILLAVLLLAAAPAIGQESVTDTQSGVGPNGPFKYWPILTVDKVVSANGYHSAVAHFTEADAWGHSKLYYITIGCRINKAPDIWGCGPPVQLKAGASYRYRVMSPTDEFGYIYPQSQSIAGDIEIIWTDPPIPKGGCAHLYYFVVRPGK